LKNDSILTPTRSATTTSSPTRLAIFVRGVTTSCSRTRMSLADTPGTPRKSTRPFADTMEDFLSPSSQRSPRKRFGNTAYYLLRALCDLAESTAITSACASYRTDRSNRPRNRQRAFERDVAHATIRPYSGSFSTSRHEPRRGIVPERSRQVVAALLPPRDYEIAPPDSRIVSDHRPQQRMPTPAAAYGVVTYESMIRYSGGPLE